MFQNEHERIAANVRQEIMKIQRYVETYASNGDQPRWPDLEALLRLAAREADRELKAEAHRATFTHTFPVATPSADQRGPDA